MRFQRGICAALFIGLGCLAVMAGCSLVTGYDGFTGTSTAACGNRIPANTAKPAAAATDTGTLVGAAQTLRFAGAAAALPATLGLDLDENCESAACAPKTGQPRTIGVDNVLGKFIGKLNPQEDISVTAIKHGTLGLLVEVTKWNGTENDDEINVSLFNVAGVNGVADGGAESKNDGNDRYIVRDTDVQAVPVPKFTFTSSKAYVTKKQLVARFEQVRLRVVDPTAAGIVAVDLPIVEAVLVGTVALVKAGIEMRDAQLVGRVRDSDMLRILSQLGLCSDSPNYSGLKSDLCGIIDLTDSKNTDGSRRSCTSGSIAIGLAIAPAKRDLATTAPATLGPYLCPDNPSDTCGGR